jgi:hypothetical protein
VVQHGSGNTDTGLRRRPRCLRRKYDLPDLLRTASDSPYGADADRPSYMTSYSPGNRSSISLLTLYSPATPPSRHLLQKARCRAVSSATRPSVSLLSPYAQLRASSVTCASACRSYSPPSSGWPTGSLRPKHHSMRFAIQYQPECCLRVPVPGLRSFLAPHPDRSHQGSPITPRRTTGAGRYAHRALSVPPSGRFARCRLRRPRSNRRTPSQPSLHALRNTKPERGVQSVRVEARTALISPRADSTPPHLSAPGSGA